MSQTLLRSVLGISGLNAILLGSLYYNSNTKLERNHEEAEARLDELEGTLRGHIGLIEESLERIEEIVAKTAGKQSGWGKGMGTRAEEMYNQRGRDEKK